MKLLFKNIKVITNFNKCLNNCSLYSKQYNIMKSIKYNLSILNINSFVISELNDKSFIINTNSLKKKSIDFKKISNKPNNHNLTIFIEDELKNNQYSENLIYNNLIYILHLLSEINTEDIKEFFNIAHNITYNNIVDKKNHNTDKKNSNLKTNYYSNDNYLYTFKNPYDKYIKYCLDGPINKNDKHNCSNDNYKKILNNKDNNYKKNFFKKIKDIEHKETLIDIYINSILDIIIGLSNKKLANANLPSKLEDDKSILNFFNDLVDNSKYNKLKTNSEYLHNIIYKFNNLPIIYTLKIFVEINYLFSLHSIKNLALLEKLSSIFDFNSNYILPKYAETILYSFHILNYKNNDINFNNSLSNYITLNLNNFNYSDMSSILYYYSFYLHSPKGLWKYIESIVYSKIGRLFNLYSLLKLILAFYNRISIEINQHIISNYLSHEYNNILEKIDNIVSGNEINTTRLSGKSIIKVLISHFLLAIDNSWYFNEKNNKSEKYNNKKHIISPNLADKYNKISDFSNFFFEYIENQKSIYEDEKVVYTGYVYLINEFIFNKLENYLYTTNEFKEEIKNINNIIKNKRGVKNSEFNNILNLPAKYILRNSFAKPIFNQNFNSVFNKYISCLESKKFNSTNYKYDNKDNLIENSICKSSNFSESYIKSSINKHNVLKPYANDVYNVFNFLRNINFYPNISLSQIDFISKEVFLNISMLKKLELIEYFTIGTNNNNKSYKYSITNINPFEIFYNYENFCNFLEFFKKSSINMLYINKNSSISLSKSYYKFIENLNNSLDIGILVLLRRIDIINMSSSLNNNILSENFNKKLNNSKSKTNKKIYYKYYKNLIVKESNLNILDKNNTYLSSNNSNFLYINNNINIETNKSNMCNIKNQYDRYYINLFQENFDNKILENNFIDETHKMKIILLISVYFNPIFISAFKNLKSKNNINDIDEKERILYEYVLLETHNLYKKHKESNYAKDVYYNEETFVLKMYKLINETNDLFETKIKVKNIVNEIINDGDSFFCLKEYCLYNNINIKDMFKTR